MLDRESTFAHPGIARILQHQVIPVAIDQAYQRRQKDAEGDFYRKIAGQSPRATPGFRGTTQGFYLADASGKLLLYNNNRNPEKVYRLVKEQVDSFRPTGAAPIEDGKSDSRFNPQPPAGGLVVRVRAKILDGYEASSDRWTNIFQCAVSRDNLWISKAEHSELVQGRFPKSLQTRIARYHLVDNTRGEPPMWHLGELRRVDISLNENRISGSVTLQTDSGDRGFDAEVLGTVQTQGGKVTDLQLVTKGMFWGEGTYTRGAPKGKFPLVVSFQLADGTDIADAIPPQGSRGWVDGYMRASR